MSAGRTRDDAHARIAAAVAEHATRAAAMLSALEALRSDRAPSVNHGHAWAEVRAWCRAQARESQAAAEHARDRLNDLARAEDARAAWIPRRGEP